MHQPYRLRNKINKQTQYQLAFAIHWGGAIVYLCDHYLIVQCIVHLIFKTEKEGRHCELILCGARADCPRSEICTESPVPLLRGDEDEESGIRINVMLFLPPRHPPFSQASSECRLQKAVSERNFRQTFLSRNFQWDNIVKHRKFGSVKVYTFTFFFLGKWHAVSHCVTLRSRLEAL